VSEIQTNLYEMRVFRQQGVYGGHQGYILDFARYLEAPTADAILDDLERGAREEGQPCTIDREKKEAMITVGAGGTEPWVLRYLVRPL
jgi:hypothetical protein